MSRDSGSGNTEEGGSCTLTAAGTALLFFLGNESFMFVEKGDAHDGNCYPEIISMGLWGC